METVTYTDRIVNGDLFKWNERFKRWESDIGYLVYVLLPKTEGGPWEIEVIRDPRKNRKIQGGNAEKLAFLVAQRLAHHVPPRTFRYSRG